MLPLFQWQSSSFAAFIPVYNFLKPTYFNYLNFLARPAHACNSCHLTLNTTLFINASFLICFDFSTSASLYTFPQFYCVQPVPSVGECWISWIYQPTMVVFMQTGVLEVKDQPQVKSERTQICTVKQNSVNYILLFPEWFQLF